MDCSDVTMGQIAFRNNLWNKKAGVSNLPICRRPGNTPEILLPAALPNVITAGLNAFGAYVAVGTPVNDYFINQLHAALLSVPNSAVQHTIEIANGAGPTTLLADRRNTTVNDPTADDSGNFEFYRSLHPVKSPAGSAIQARAFCSDAVVNRTYTLLTAGFDNVVPIWNTLAQLSLTGPESWLPSDTTFTGVTAAVLPNYGAWVQFLAAAAADSIISHIAIQGTPQSILSPITAYQIGIGAAGAEIPVATIIGGRGLPFVEIHPVIKVLAGERVAVRATSQAAAARPVAINLIPI